MLAVVISLALLSYIVLYVFHRGDTLYSYARQQDTEKTSDHIVTKPIECHSPLLTLFTTFKESQAKRNIYANTLQNWARLRPYVIPVLYVVEDSVNDANRTKDATGAFMTDEATAQGWTVVRAPEVWDGLPVLRTMFSDVIQRSKTPFYGYANGDILFVENLIQTLCHVQQNVNWTQFLVTSRRTNAKYDPGDALNSSAAILSVAKQRGVLFYPHSEDLFIATADGYPWSSMPRFVVGRVGFDNWMVANALLNHIPVIDVTDTVLSLHMTDFEGNEAGRFSNGPKDWLRNLNLVAKDFLYSLGSVTCAPYETRWTSGGVVQLGRRQIEDPKCLKAYRQLGVDMTFDYRNYWANLCSVCIRAFNVLFMA